MLLAIYTLMLCCILRYLKRAFTRGLLHRYSTSLSVTGFSDVDWAGSHTDHHSTSGYCTFVGDNLFTWCSKKQNFVAQSSVEAEYHAKPYTASERLWICSLYTILWQSGYYLHFK